MYDPFPGPIVDFLQLRIKRHPKIIGAILQPTRAQLEQYAGNLAMVIVRRIQDDKC